MRPADQPEHTPRPDAFQVLFENAGTMVCTLDPGGRITSLNRAGERLTGYPAEELVGLEAIHVLAPEARAEAVEQFRRRFEDGAGRAVDETVLLTRDARRITVQVT